VNLIKFNVLERGVLNVSFIRSLRIRSSGGSVVDII
jgi:hypothetical protein